MPTLESRKQKVESRKQIVRLCVLCVLCVSALNVFAADPTETPTSNSQLRPLLDLLGGGHGKWLLSIITWFGTLSAVLAPFSVWLQHKLTDLCNTAAASSEVDDDEWLRKLYGNPIYRFWATLLRFVHIRLPTLADLERALKLQHEAITQAGLTGH